MKADELPDDAIPTEIPNLFACPNGDVYSFRLSINKAKPKKAGIPIIGKLTPHKVGHGYYTIRYCGKQYKHHRIIAQTFIQNKENKETVNHKDFDKSNNSADNLEWATRSENSKHAFNGGKLHHIHKKKKISQYDVDGNFIKTFNNSDDAAEYINGSKCVIQRVAQGVREKAYGYHWKYE